MAYQELKQRVANLRTAVATQRARLEQAEIQVAEKEKAILDTYGTTPDQLAAALDKADAEIQQAEKQILDLLVAAGA